MRGGPGRADGRRRGRDRGRDAATSTSGPQTALVSGLPCTNTTATTTSQRPSEPTQTAGITTTVVGWRRRSRHRRATLDLVGHGSELTPVSRTPRSCRDLASHCPRLPPAHPMMLSGDRPNRVLSRLVTGVGVTPTPHRRHRRSLSAVCRSYVPRSYPFERRQIGLRADAARYRLVELLAAWTALWPPHSPVVRPRALAATGCGAGRDHERQIRGRAHPRSRPPAAWKTRRHRRRCPGPSWTARSPRPTGPARRTGGPR
jgi:hypothetical protein